MAPMITIVCEVVFDPVLVLGTKYEFLPPDDRMTRLVYHIGWAKSFIFPNLATNQILFTTHFLGTPPTNESATTPQPRVCLLFSAHTLFPRLKKILLKFVPHPPPHYYPDDQAIIQGSHRRFSHFSVLRPALPRTTLMNSMEALDADNFGSRHDDVGAFDDHGTTHELIFKPLSRQGSKESLGCEDVAECAAALHIPCDSHSAFEPLTSDKICNGSALLRRSPTTPYFAFENQKRGVEIIGDALQRRIEEKMATIELLQKLAQLESKELEMNPDAADSYALPRTRRRCGGLRGRRGLRATADSSSTEEEVTSSTAAATTTYDARAPDLVEQVKQTWTQLRAEMRIASSIQNLYATTPVPAKSEQWILSNEDRRSSAQALRMTQENCNW